MPGSAISHELIIDIGNMPVLVRTDRLEFLSMIEGRYGGFLNSGAQPLFEFDIELVPSGTLGDSDDDVSVGFERGRWLIERGDLRAEFDPGHGAVTSCNRPIRIPSTPPCASFTP